MTPLIRDYKAKDRTALEKLMVVLQEHLVDIDPLKRQRCTRDYGRKYVVDLLKQTRKGDGKIFVAEEDGDVVGCSACVVLRQSATELLNEYPLVEGRVLELVVLPGMRGKGIGTALMHAAEEYLQDKGCSGARVAVFTPNQNARCLYERLGYTERVADLIKLF